MIRSLAILLALGAAGMAADALRSGDAFPVVSGRTVSDKQIELPASGAGTTRVLVSSFSKAASADSRLWTQRMAKDADLQKAATVYRAIMLESIPKLFRGMAVSGIKSGLPRELWDTAILVNKDEALWKKRLAVTVDGHSYIVLLDGKGVVRWVSSGAFSDAEYSQMKEQLPR